MRGFAGALVLAATAFLACGSRAAEKADGGAVARAPLQAGLGAYDPRIPVDPEFGPWRAVGKLQAAAMNLRSLCTATLVGPSTIVTAAHCLFNRRTRRYFPPMALHFLIGYRGNSYAGHAIAIGVRIGDGYDPGRPKETIGSDWALVSLDKSLGSADRVLPILSAPPEDGATVMLGGYEQDHPVRLTADPQCRVVGRFVDGNGRLLLRHNCTGTNGASGAPLLIARGGGWQIAAIEVAGKMGIAGGTAVVLEEAIRRF